MTGNGMSFVPSRDGMQSDMSVTPAGHAIMP
jgi:hypothetical protein